MQSSLRRGLSRALLSAPRSFPSVQPSFTAPRSAHPLAQISLCGTARTSGDCMSAYRTAPLAFPAAPFSTSAAAAPSAAATPSAAQQPLSAQAPASAAPAAPKAVSTALPDLGPDAAYIRPNVIAPNYPRVASLLASMTADGPSRLMFVADFDYTLSMPGGLSSWSIIDSSARMPEPFRTQCLVMARKYFPIEASLTLTRAEKHPVLNEWFNSFHGLIRQQPFTPAMLADICAESITPHDAGAAPAARSAATESTSAAAPFTRLPLAAVPADSVHSPCDRSTPFALSMRHGFHTLAAELAAADVPTVVVSAGIGNFIVDALRRNGLSSPVPLLAETAPTLARSLSAGLSAPATAAAAAGAMRALSLCVDPSATVAGSGAHREKSGATPAHESAPRPRLPVYVAGNFAAFDYSSDSASGVDAMLNATPADARVARFLPSDPIHVYSKCDVQPLHFLERAFAAHRGYTEPLVGDTATLPAGGLASGMNVLLVGDSLGDATITDSLPGAKSILTVGFLNLRPGLNAMHATDAAARAAMPHTCTAHSKPAAATATTAPAAAGEAAAVAPDGCPVPKASDPEAEFNTPQHSEAAAGRESQAAPASSPAQSKNAVGGSSGKSPAMTTAEAMSITGHSGCLACASQVAAARLRKHCETFDIVVVDDGGLSVPIDIVRAIVAGVPPKGVCSL